MTDVLSFNDSHMSDQFDRTTKQRAQHAQLMAQAFNEGASYDEAQASANAIMFKEFATELRPLVGSRFSELVVVKTGGENSGDGLDVFTRARTELADELAQYVKHTRSRR